MLCTLELLFKLLFRELDTHRPSMRAVFDIVPGENLAHQGLSLSGLGVPAGLDGGLAGHGVEKIIAEIAL